MATKYKPKEKVRFLCACGCGRVGEGNAGKKYYEPYCRFKAFVKRREEQENAA